MNKRIFNKRTTGLVLTALMIFTLATCEPEFRHHPAAPGLQLRDLSSGSGRAARDGDLLVLHYRGTTPVAGAEVEFFNSHERAEPVMLPLLPNRLVKGFKLGLTGMRAGGKREIIVPPELAYGKEGAGGVIPPDATLKFSVELLEIRPLPVAFEHGKLDRHALGFQYAIVNEGAGTPPKKGDFVRVHFSRFDRKDELLDSSYFYGGAYEFHLGQPGIPAAWNEIVARMKPGGKATLVIPHRLLLEGERAGIDKGDPLRYDIEFLNVAANHYEEEHRTAKKASGAEAHAH